MCRNITTLRGLQPAATSDEIEAAARQYVRKVSGVQSTSAATSPAFEVAVRHVADAIGRAPGRAAAATPTAADAAPAPPSSGRVVLTGRAGGPG